MDKPKWLIGQSLCVVIQKNLRQLEKCLQHIEFAYHRYVHSATLFSPFEVFYGFNLLTSLDILPLPTKDHTNLNGKKKVEFGKELHVKVRANIERKNEQYAKQENRKHVKVVFEPRD